MQREEWQRAVDALQERATRDRRVLALSIYPWDIVTEMERRLESPQAMLLVVPNGKVKLLNALPFAPADLRRDSLDAGVAGLPGGVARDPKCASSSPSAATQPALLGHANETWPMDTNRGGSMAPADVPTAGLTQVKSGSSRRE